MDAATQPLLLVQLSVSSTESQFLLSYVLEEKWLGWYRKRGSLSIYTFSCYGRKIKACLILETILS